MTEEVFLLFEDTKKSHRGFSFTQPVESLRAEKLEDVKAVLAQATQWQRKGFYVAGYVSYEAGWALLPKKTRQPRLPNYPLVDLYVFKTKNVFNSFDSDLEKAYVYDFKSSTTFEKYRADLEQVFARLRGGDTYQVNYTHRMSLESTADAWVTYSTLRKAQRVEYAAFLNLPHMQVLSFSPELFVKRTGRKLLAKPMKGTKARSADPIIDHNHREFLLNDEKNRAENVMIVDLLRNDLGQIAMPGTVKVNSLFQIEDYETVFQMVSEIECEIDESLTFDHIFSTLFPCGSITGAPKLSTMEIINDLEAEPRGIYTGAIGYMDPNGDFTFNVAIRTLVKKSGAPYVYGVGGGILIDSNIEDEHREASLKGRFLNTANGEFSLFESFLYDGRAFRNLNAHLSRLEASARYFAFDYSLEDIKHHLQALTSKEPCRVKLSLWNDGRLQVETYSLEPVPPKPEAVISTTRIDSGNLFQRHKTSLRRLYDDQYKKARTVGFYEVIYLNEKEEVAEASRHNVFIKKDGQWLTPPVSAGALPGIERANLIRDLKAQEKTLTVADLKSAQDILLTNSVRGSVSVKLRDAL